jgi:hypothetical protein
MDMMRQGYSTSFAVSCPQSERHRPFVDHCQGQKPPGLIGIACPPPVAAQVSSREIRAKHYSRGYGEPPTVRLSLASGSPL